MSVNAFNLSIRAQEALDALVADAMATGSFYVVSHLDEVQRQSRIIGDSGSAADVMLAVLDKDGLTKDFNKYKSSLVQELIDALDAQADAS